MFRNLGFALRKLLIGGLLLVLFPLGSACAQTLNVIGLLLPDNTPVNDARVTAWIDAARNEGLRMQVIYDTQFLQMGYSALNYRGIVLPDLLHTRASDALVVALENYVAQGGRTMLVFDFGALTDTGFYPVPKSRFSSMAGVDYILYEELRERTTGLGPVTGLENWLRMVQVPPGKSIPYAAALRDENPVMTPGQRTAGKVPSAILENAHLALNEALYLPVSPADPGGAQGFDFSQFSQVPYGRSGATLEKRGISAPVGQNAPGGLTLNFGAARKAKKVSGVTQLVTSSTFRNRAALRATANNAAPAANPDPLQAVSDSGRLHAVSGYLLGALTYPSYVTRGAYSGSQIAMSPDFGLIAGARPFGLGEVLFVNLPLTHLTGSSDGMLMQGFLRFFGVDLLEMPRLSAQPNGRAGLTLNWHLDSQEALQPMQALKTMGVWNEGPFSINLTAGPDNIVIGDGLGFDLPHNMAARQFLREFDAAGHAIGSHGGWAHDYYGHNANETNEAEFKQYLVLNRNAVDGVIGHRTREYSAPEGNNPIWAMNWLEANGVVAAYYAGHTGLGPTRNYRDGVLRNPSMWVCPVSPFGLYATFEEFQNPALGIQKQDVIAWYRAMVDFSIKNRTSRLIYMHPPGAAVWPDVVQDLLSYARAKRQAGQFSWYTMLQLADFMTARAQVQWTETLAANGDALFEASHPASLAAMTWLLPKDSFTRPIVTAGSATVADGNDSWMVRGTGGRTLRYTAGRL